MNERQQSLPKLRPLLDFGPLIVPDPSQVRVVRHLLDDGDFPISERDRFIAAPLPPTEKMGDRARQLVGEQKGPFTSHHLVQGGVPAKYASQILKRMHQRGTIVAVERPAHATIPVTGRPPIWYIRAADPDGEQNPTSRPSFV